MKKFIDGFKEFIKNLTYEEFKEKYTRITSLYASSFLPEESVLIHYFNFIKSLKAGYNGNFINVVLAPRECYKTLTFSKVFPLMLILNSISKESFNDLSTIILGSYLMKDVKTNIYSDIQTALSRLKGVKVIISNAKEMIIEANKKRMLIKTISARSTLRSTNISGRRPQLLILDDIDQPRADKQLSTREYSVTRFTTDWLPAIENQNAVIFVIGNLEHKISIINHLLKIEEVNKLILPAKIDGKYIRKIWNEKWEEKTREILGDEEFERLYFHKLSTDNLETTDEFIKENTKAFIDVGVQDRTMAISFIAGNTIIDVFKGNLQEFINEGITMLKYYDPKDIYYEKNGLQDALMKEIIKTYIPEYNMRLRGIVSNTNKEERLALTLLKIQSKDLKISSYVEEEILEEIEIYKSGGNPHLLDSISFFVTKFLREEPDIDFRL